MQQKHQYKQTDPNTRLQKQADAKTHFQKQTGANTHLQKPTDANTHSQKQTFTRTHTHVKDKDAHTCLQKHKEHNIIGKLVYVT